MDGYIEWLIEQKIMSYHFDLAQEPISAFQVYNLKRKIYYAKFENFHKDVLKPELFFCLKFYV